MISTLPGDWHTVADWLAVWHDWCGWFVCAPARGADITVAAAAVTPSSVAKRFTFMDLSYVVMGS